MTDTRAAFLRRWQELQATRPADIVAVYDSGVTPRELVAPDECDHTAEWCDDTSERSECSGCGQKRNRADCGENDEQTAALDRLDVTIRDHPMAGNARQWRLIAADLILELQNMDGTWARDVTAALHDVRHQHDARTITHTPDA